MKRPIALCLALTAAVGGSVVVGCSRQAEPTTATAPDQNGWITSPDIDRVEAGTSGLIVYGHAAPLGRVVLSGPGDRAYAVGADEAGKFELRVPRPSRDTLFLVEARAGEVAYPSPYRLLVAADAAGPIALLASGAPTRRLDAGPALDVVDSDGRATFLSGRAGSGTVVALTAGSAMQVTAGQGGRWTASVGGDGTAPVRIGGALFMPVTGQPASEGVLDRAGAGWRIGWSGPGGARQVSWFPDRPA